MEHMTRKVEQMARKNAKKKFWRRVVAVPAAAVVFITTYALILPAIAMEGDTYCGLEAHKHTEECYVREVACGYESGQMVETVTGGAVEMLCAADIHQHDASCHDAEGNIVCGYADFVVHEQHDANCYDAQGNLICTLPIVKAHTHTDECYAVEKVSVCGQEESEGHVHTPECYAVTETKTLVCGEEESAGHTHTPECYTTYNNTYLSCTLPESAGHAHTEACYDAEGNLICGLEESEGHTHTDACYTTETVQELTCGQAESAGHTHTDACYAVTETEELVCGKEESEGHTHTDECFAEEKVLVCDKEEIILHTHDDTCYDQYGNLICGETEIREHTHTADCFSDGRQVVQTPHEHTDLCYVLSLVCDKPEHVHSMLCYQEPAPTAEPEAEPEAEPAEEPAESETVEESADEAPAEEAEEPAETDETAEAEAEATAEPEPTAEPTVEIEEEQAPIYNEPDLICGKTEHTHTIDCQSGALEFICGVEGHFHTADCYAAPMQKDDGIVKSFSDGRVSVLAIYGPEANIPDNAVLNVYRLTEDSPRYAQRLAETKALLNSDTREVMDVELYNIGFYVDGVEIEPEAPVSVTIRFLEASDFHLNDDVSVVHFGEDGTEILNADTDELVNAATFETNSFSDFALRAPAEDAGENADNNIEENTEGNTEENTEPVQTPAQASELTEATETPATETPATETAEPTAVPKINMGASQGAKPRSNSEGNTMAVANEATVTDDLSKFLKDLQILDSNDKKYEGDVLVTGQSYKMNFVFEEDENFQFASGELTLDLKRYVKSGDVQIKDVSGKGAITIDDVDGVREIPYEYYVKDGVLHVTLPDDVQGFPRVGFNADLEFVVESGNKDTKVEIDGPGETDYHFNVEPGLPELEKTAGEYDPVHQTVDYTVEVKASGGSISGYTLSDTLKPDKDGNLPLTYGDEVEVQLTVYKEDGVTVDEERSGTVKAKVTVDKTTGEEKFVLEEGLPELKLGERMEVTYQAKLKEEFSTNGIIEGSYTVDNVVNLNENVDGGFDIDREAEVKVESQAVDKHSGSVEGEFLYWHVDIGSGAAPLGEVTFKDTLTGEHTFAKEESPNTEHAKHQNEGLVLRVYDPETGDVKYVVVIPWDQVKFTDGDKTMTYTIPDMSEDFPTGCKVYDTNGNEIQSGDFKAPKNYYLEAEYYTKYTRNTVGSTTFENTVETTIHGKPYSDSGSATVGPDGTVIKRVANEDNVVTDDLIRYTIDVTNVRPTLEYSGHYYAPFRIRDQLTLEGPNGEKLYVENLPRELKVYMELNGNGVLSPLSPHEGKYDKSATVSVDGGSLGTDNAYGVRTSSSYPFEWVDQAAGKDKGTEIGLLYIVFNSDDPNSSTYTSNDKLVLGTALHFDKMTDSANIHVEYYLPLSARVYKDDQAQTKEAGVEDDNCLGTLREYLDKGWTLVNKAKEEYYHNKSSEASYIHPEFNQPVRKTGEVRTETADDGTKEYYIDYEIEIKDVGANGKGTLFTHQDLYDGITVSDTISPLDFVDSVTDIYAESWSADGSTLNGRYRMLNKPWNSKANSHASDFGEDDYLSFTHDQLAANGGGFSFEISDKYALYSVRDNVTPGTGWSDDNDYRAFYGGVHRKSSGIGAEFDYHTSGGKNGYDYEPTDDDIPSGGKYTYKYETKTGEGKVHSGEPQILKFKYTVKLNSKLVEEMKGSVQSFLNTASVGNGDKGGKDDCVVDVRNGAMEKSVSQAGNGSAYLDFVININKDRNVLLPEDSEEKTLTLEDTMSQNLEFLETGLHVYSVDEAGIETEITDSQPIYYDWDSTSHVLTLSNIPDGTHIRIKYQARVTDTGDGVHITNDAKLEVVGNYTGNTDKYFNVTNSSSEGHTKADSFVLHKKDASGKAKYGEMKGARFLLYIIDDHDPRTGEYPAPKENNFNYGAEAFFEGIGNGYFLKEVDIENTDRATVGDEMLQDGWHYVLVEVEAPDGYMVPSPPNNVTEFYMESAPADVGVNVKVVENRGGLTIENTSYDYELPETGGEGTAIFTLGGMALLAMAGAVFCGRQRRKARSHR